MTTNQLKAKIRAIYNDEETTENMMTLDLIMDAVNDDDNGEEAVNQALKEVAVYVLHDGVPMDGDGQVIVALDLIQKVIDAEADRREAAEEQTAVKA